MVKASAFDDAPSPATVMLAVPAVAMSAAGTLAVNWDALTNVVASGAPFHCTLELAVKLAPVTVKVKAAPPGAAALGLRLASEAAGVVEMDSTSTLEVRGPVLETVILAVPGAAIKAADTCAVNCVALTPVMAGMGAFTVKIGAWGETSEPGLTTWMTCDPTFAMALGGTLTVSWFTLT